MKIIARKDVSVYEVICYLDGKTKRVFVENKEVRMAFQTTIDYLSSGGILKKILK